MADEKPDPAPGGKRRRPPTTIDLKATEVAPEPAASSEPSDIPQEKAPEPQADAPTAAPESNPEPPRQPPPPNSPPRAAGWRPEWLGPSAMNDRFSALRSRASERFDWRLIGAGGAGAAAMFILFVAFWLAGAFGGARDEQAAMTARLAAMESQLRVIAARPQPAAPDQKPFSDLAARVTAAEQAMGRLPDLDTRIAKAEATAATPRAVQPDQALTARLAELEAAVRPLAELHSAVDAASSAARDAKGRADAAFDATQKIPAPPPGPQVVHSEIDSLAARLAALEQTAKTIDERIAKATAASAGADRPARLAFAAMTLRAAVESGAPYGQELAAAKSLAPDAASLAPLEPLAAAGAPSTAALTRELSQLVNPMLDAAAGTPREGGGILDRIQQNAARLVRLRPIGETAGDDPATVVARAEAKAARGDFGRAASELASLPPAVRAPAEGWIKQAQAQSVALAAARKLAADAVGALAKAAP